MAAVVSAAERTVETLTERAGPSGSPARIARVIVRGPKLAESPNEVVRVTTLTFNEATLALHEIAAERVREMLRESAAVQPMMADCVRLSVRPKVGAIPKLAVNVSNLTLTLAIVAERLNAALRARESARIGVATNDTAVCSDRPKTALGREEIHVVEAASARLTDRAAVLFIPNELVNRRPGARITVAVRADAAESRREMLLAFVAVNVIVTERVREIVRGAHPADIPKLVESVCGIVDPLDAAINAVATIDQGELPDQVQDMTPPDDPACEDPASSVPFSDVPSVKSEV